MPARAVAVLHPTVLHPLDGVVDLDPESRQTEYMAVSDHDKDYMRRLAEFEGEGQASRLRAHLSLAISERLQRSLHHWARFRESIRSESRKDSPDLFYERAKRLGLYVS